MIIRKKKSLYQKQTVFNEELLPESLNMTLRKFIKNKRVFLSDEAVFKQIYLANARYC